MSFNEAQARIKSRIWQAVAQTNLDLSDVPKEKVEALVNLITEAALLEMDEEMEETLAQTEKEAEAAGTPIPNPFDDVEEILWEGRPFLSISTRYIITDERVRVIEGLLGKSRQDVELVRIQSMEQTQAFGERLFKLGDITIRSADTNNPLIVLNNVPDPERVHEILRRAVLKARDKYKLSYREEM